MSKSPSTIHLENILKEKCPKLYTNIYSKISTKLGFTTREVKAYKLGLRLLVRWPAFTEESMLCNADQLIEAFRWSVFTDCEIEQFTKEFPKHYQVLLDSESWQILHAALCDQKD